MNSHAECRLCARPWLEQVASICSDPLYHLSYSQTSTYVQCDFGEAHEEQIRQNKKPVIFDDNEPCLSGRWDLNPRPLLTQNTVILYTVFKPIKVGNGAGTVVNTGP
jgi:hypothetical protein